MIRYISRSNPPEKKRGDTEVPTKYRGLRINSAGGCCWVSFFSFAEKRERRSKSCGSVGGGNWYSTSLGVNLEEFQPAAHCTAQQAPEREGGGVQV
jgi:hypothetical protein